MYQPVTKLPRASCRNHCGLPRPARIANPQADSRWSQQARDSVDDAGGIMIPPNSLGTVTKVLAAGALTSLLTRSLGPPVSTAAQSILAIADAAYALCLALV